MLKGRARKMLMGMVESDEMAKKSRNAGRQGKIGQKERRKEGSDPIENVIVTRTKGKAVARNGKMTGRMAPTKIERKMTST
jgi:hypothetical protein